MQKAKAVVEVVVVLGLTLLLIALVGLSPVGEWERQVSSRFFIEYAVMIAFPLLLLAATGRSRAGYGISLRNVRYHLDIAATAFVPVAMASTVIAFVDYREWHGSLILAAVQIALLFALGWLLQKKPSAGENGALPKAIFSIACSAPAIGAKLANGISAFVSTSFFSGSEKNFCFEDMFSPG